jgi:hypothetical protein
MKGEEKKGLVLFTEKGYYASGHYALCFMSGEKKFALYRSHVINLSVNHLFSTQMAATTLISSILPVKNS